MLQRFLLLAALSATCAQPAAGQDANENDPNRPGAEKAESSEGDRALLVWPKDNPADYTGIVTMMNEDGTTEVAAMPDTTGRLIEGLYLGLFYEVVEGQREAPKMTGALVQVSEVKELGNATLKLDKAAVKPLANATHCLLVRPEYSTTSQLKKLPAVFVIETVKSRFNFGATAIESMNKLRQLGIALHMYADVNGEQIVPAVVYGPDDKPWHSWRVLLLSAMGKEEQKLFDDYRLDEPWDGPNNKKLLEKMPEVYRHPLDKEGTSETRYVVGTGPNAALEESAMRFAKKELFLSEPIRSRTTFGSVIDGLSNTIFVGECREDAKVPWTKPEDLVFDKDFPGVNKEGGFAATYEQSEASKPKFGVFAFMDASVQGIEETIEAESLVLLIGRNDRQPVRYPRLGGESDRPNAFELRIVEGKEGPIGRLHEIKIKKTRNPRGAFKQSDEGQATQVVLENVSQAIRVYQIQVGRFPTSLKDLFRKPALVPRGRRWAGPYLNDIPQDGWGQVIEFVELDAGYELRSAGVDGELKTADDIVLER